MVRQGIRLRNGIFRCGDNDRLNAVEISMFLSNFIYLLLEPALLLEELYE